MKKIIFLILVLFNFNIFSSEDKKMTSQVDLIINKQLHQLKFNEIELPMRPKITKIELTLNDKLIGYVTYKEKEKNIFQIINLYIYKDFRLQGYACRLLKFVCCHLIKYGAIKFLLTPYPFEEVNGICHYGSSSADGGAILLRLIKLYNKFGFVKSESTSFMEMELIPHK